MENLDNYISELQKLTPLLDERSKGSIKWYISWYEKRFPSRRWYYRGSGTVILLIGLFSAYLFNGQSPSWSTLLGVLVSFIVSLKAFFAWGIAWRTYYVAKVRLEFQLHLWSAKLIAVKNITDESKGIEVVGIAFDELVNKSCQVIEEEAKGFFENIKFHSLKQKFV